MATVISQGINTILIQEKRQEYRLQWAQNSLGYMNSMLYSYNSISKYIESIINLWGGLENIILKY